MKRAVQSYKLIGINAVVTSRWRYNHKPASEIIFPQTKGLEPNPAYIKDL